MGLEIMRTAAAPLLFAELSRGAPWFDVQPIVSSEPPRDPLSCFGFTQTGWSRRGY
jgi:hypothetical protein